MKGDELRHAAITGNAEVRRHPLPSDRGEIRVLTSAQLPGEQRFDPRAAKLAWRQADAMEHHERQRSSRGARILIGRGHYPGASQQAGTDVD